VNEVVLVYLEWFRRNSLLKCVSQPEIAKKSLKTPILGSRSSILVPPENSSAVLLWYAASLYLYTTVLTLDELIVL